MSSRRFRFFCASVGVLALFSIYRVAAFQWPVADQVLTATFGESRWDHFHTGIDLGGGAQPVFPIDSGEVVFFDRSIGRPRAPVAGLGAYVVVEHDRGIRSLYAHLEPGSFDSLPVELSASDQIGVIGDSGASLGKHLHLEVIDSELRSYVNPLIVLPPLVDTVSPTVGRLMILDPRSERAEPSPLMRGQRVTAGEHRLLIEVFDLSEHVPYYCPMAPFEITGYFNGSQVFALEFDSLSSEDGTLVLGSDRDGPSFVELYREDWVLDVGAIPFRVGEIQIEIAVRDLAGNESNYRLPVTVE